MDVPLVHALLKNPIADQSENGSAVDLVGLAQSHLLLLHGGAFTDITKAFVRVQESDEGIVWYPLGTHELFSDSTQIKALKRTRRHLRVVTVLEVDADPLADITILLLTGRE